MHMIKRILSLHFLVVISFFQLEALLFSSLIDVTTRLDMDQLPLHCSLSADNTATYRSVVELLSNDATFYHSLKSADAKTGMVTLDDESIWQVTDLAREDLKHWQVNNRLKIFYSPDLAFNIEIENVSLGGSVRGGLKTGPVKSRRDLILQVVDDRNGLYNGFELFLRSGWSFKGEANKSNSSIEWNINDEIFIFHSHTGYDLCNMTQKKWIKNCALLSKIEEKPFEVEIMTLESRLNQRILGQAEATNAVSNRLINYKAGLKESKTPIAVFLFLGPSGVGKTELAKVLALEFFKSPDKFIRFDMSHFSEAYSSSRLIGSAPGYLNHEEGGQLSEFLKKHPHSLVLLDEIEKAHPVVRKIFLPVFDEGYLTDTKNVHFSCQEAIFIMTSNLCSQEIRSLVDAGFDTDEILEQVEPMLIEALSPELYNRVQPIIFHPLNPSVMNVLVDLMLKEIAERLMQTKNIELHVDDLAKNYLAMHGYHPALGARPLKKLIEKKVTGTLAYALVTQAIPSGSTIILSYSMGDDGWHVEFR